LAKNRENSPVATGLKSPEIAKNGDFYQKWPKMAILRGSAPFRGILALLGPFPRGFYINPSGALPRGRGTPGSLPRRSPGPSRDPGIRDLDPSLRQGAPPAPGGGFPGTPGPRDPGSRAPDPRRGGFYINPSRRPPAVPRGPGRETGPSRPRGGPRLGAGGKEFPSFRRRLLRSPLGLC